MQDKVCSITKVNIWKIIIKFLQLENYENFAEKTLEYFNQIS